MRLYRKKDKSKIVLLAIGILLIPLLFMPGFPTVLFDQDYGVFWKKSIGYVLLENSFFILMAFAIAIVIVILMRMVDKMVF